MNKVVIIGQNGILSNKRDENVDKAIKEYCEEYNITREEFNKKDLSIYQIEFKGNVKVKLIEIK